MRAANSTRYAQKANVFSVPVVAAVTINTPQSNSNSWWDKVRHARTKRGQPVRSAGQGRRSGPMTTPNRNAISIQPQISKTDTNAMYTFTTLNVVADTTSPAMPSAANYLSISSAIISAKSKHLKAVIKP